MGTYDRGRATIAARLRANAAAANRRGAHTGGPTGSGTVRVSKPKPAKKAPKIIAKAVAARGFTGQAKRPPGRRGPKTGGTGGSKSLVTSRDRYGR